MRAFSQPAAGQHIESLTALRGVAAMSVVLYHGLLAVPGFDGIRFETSGLGEFATLVNMASFTPLQLAWDGPQAVALFFVLSGFVLALPFAAGRSPSYSAFIIRRICRIYLPYAAALALALALRALVDLTPPAGASSWSLKFWSMPIGPYTVTDNILMLGAGRADTIDPPIWSLVVEMRISLLFPLLVATAQRFGTTRSILGAYALYLPLRLAAKYMSIDYGGAWFSAVETLGSAPLFLLGVGLALNVDRITRALEACRSRDLAFIACAGALLLWFDPHIEKPHLRDILVGPGSALLIGVCLDRRGLSRVLAIRPLKWIGEISYSLYLVHLPLLLVMIYGLRSVATTSTIILAFLALAVPAAAAFNLVIERPATELGRKLTLGRTARTSAAASS